MDVVSLWLRVETSFRRVYTAGNAPEDFGLNHIMLFTVKMQLAKRCSQFSYEPKKPVAYTRPCAFQLQKNMLNPCMEECVTIAIFHTQ